MRTRHLVLIPALLALLLVAPTFAKSFETLDSQIAIDPVPAPTATSFEDCDEIVENTTSTTKTVTVTLCNLGGGPMYVDVSGTRVATIRSGKCKTLIVELGPGEFLHADEPGTVVVVVPPITTAKQP